ESERSGELLLDADRVLGAFGLDVVGIDEADVLAESGGEAERASRRRGNARRERVRQAVDRSAGGEVVIAGALRKAGADGCLEDVEVNDSEAAADHGGRGGLVGSAN